MEHAELVFGDARDIALVLDRSFDLDQPIARNAAAAAAAFEAFPRLQRLVCTLRQEPAVRRQRLSGFMASREGVCHTPEIDMQDVVDRIGAGDAFAAGVLHGLIRGMADERALRFGLAAAAFKHSVRGDFNLARAEDIEAAMGDPGLSVRR
jgi:2-dehydro-3-deoxygluconokinase